jgi:thymidylate synthase
MEVNVNKDFYLRNSFLSVNVEGKNIDEVWFRLLVELCDKGRFYKITEGSYAGDFRLEFDNVDGVIHRPIVYNEYGIKYPLAPTVPMGCPAPTTDKDIQEYYETYLIDSNLTDNEHYKYATFIVGGRYKIPDLKLNIRNKYDIKLEVDVPNQMKWCENHYREKGFGNNHCCMAIAYPESNLAYDVPYTNETDRGTSPCLRLIDTKITYDPAPIDEYFLNFYVYFRSWDLWGGFPVNMGGLSLLMEQMAYNLGIFPGAIKFGSKGLHVYGHSLEPLAMRAGNHELAEKFKMFKENK